MLSSSLRLTLAAALLAVVTTTGCSSLTQGTVAGAGIGGVTGAVITDGSPTGAAVGAVVGGAVGRQVEKRRGQ